MSEHIEQIYREHNSITEQIAAIIEKCKNSNYKAIDTGLIRELTEQADTLEELRGGTISSPVWTAFYKSQPAEYVRFTTPWFFHISTFLHDSWMGGVFELKGVDKDAVSSLSIPYGTHVEASYVDGYLTGLTTIGGKSRGRDLTDRMQFFSIPKHVNNNFTGHVWGVLYLDDKSLAIIESRYRVRFERMPTITNLLISDIITRDNPYFVDMAHVSFALIGDSTAQNKKIFTADEATSLGFTSSDHLDQCPVWRTIYHAQSPNGLVVIYKSGDHDIEKVVFDDVTWECDTKGTVSPVIIATEWEKGTGARILIRTGNTSVINHDYYRKGTIAEVKNLGGVYLVSSFFSVPHDSASLGEIPTHCQHCGSRLLLTGETVQYLNHQETNNECPGVVAARIREFNRILDIHIPDESIEQFVTTGGIADLGDYVCADKSFILSMLQAMNGVDSNTDVVAKEFVRRNAFIHTSLKSHSLDGRLWTALILATSIDGLNENTTGLIVEFLEDQLIGAWEENCETTDIPHPLSGIVGLMTDYAMLLSIGITQMQAARIFRSASLRRDELYRYFGHFLGL